MAQDKSAGAKAPADEKEGKFCLRNQAGEEVGEIDFKRRVGTLKTGAMNTGGLISVSLTPAEDDEDGEAAQ